MSPARRNDANRLIERGKLRNGFCVPVQHCVAGDAARSAEQHHMLGIASKYALRLFLLGGELHRRSSKAEAATVTEPLISFSTLSRQSAGLRFFSQKMQAVVSGG